MSVDYKLIGSRIKIKRNAIGMTQENLAEKIDVSVGYVSQLERGITKISLSTLAEISTVLGVDMSYFVTGAATENSAYLSDELMKRYAKLTSKQKKQILAFMEIMLDIG